MLIEMELFSLLNLYLNLSLINSIQIEDQFAILFTWFNGNVHYNPNKLSDKIISILELSAIDSFGQKKEG